MEPLWVALALVAHTVLLAVVMRRFLGIPVGWLRTALVAGTLMLTGGAVLTSLGTDLGLVVDGGSPAPGVSPLALTLVIVLLGAWWVALGMGLLLVAELVAPSNQGPGPISVVRGTPGWVRRNRRYATVTAIAARHGLGGFLRPGTHARTGPDEAPRIARALRLALSDAGVTFVKLGQMLATRPDLVGTEFAQELGRLQADVAAEDWATIEAVIDVELGRPHGEVFATVEHEPLAAASVGQVHAATLRDGRAVVLKVQRPRAREQARADVDIILRLADTLTRRAQWARDLDLNGLARGFVDSLEEELDYRTEAANTRAVAATLPADGHIRVPRVEEDLTTSRLLVMERMDGLPLSRARREVAAVEPQHRAALADELLGLVLRQVVEHGVFHADLHGGNVLLQPGGTLALLDLGSVGRLDRASREALGRLLLAFETDDGIAATDALLDVLDRPATLDDRALEREVGQLVTRHRLAGGSRALFTDLLRLVTTHGLRVPPQLAAAFRALGALEGTLTELDPRVDLVDASRRLGREIGRERMAPGAVRDELTMQLGRLVPVLERLPRRVEDLTRQAGDGQLTLRLRMLDHPDDRAFLAGLVHQVTTALVTLACTVLALGLLLAPGGPEVLPGLRLLPLLGSGFLLVAFSLAARVLAQAFTSRPG